MRRVRYYLFLLYLKFKPDIWDSIDQHLIGYTGYVSDLDRRVACTLGTPTPSKLEVWLSRDFVAMEQKIRRGAWHDLLDDLT